MQVNGVLLTKGVNKVLRKNFRNIMTKRETMFDNGKKSNVRDLQYPFEKLMCVDLYESSVDTTPCDLIGKAMFRNLAIEGVRNGCSAYDLLIDMIFNMMIDSFNISEEESLKELRRMYKWKKENIEQVNKWIEEVS